MISRVASLSPRRALPRQPTSSASSSVIRTSWARGSFARSRSGAFLPMRRIRMRRHGCSSAGRWRSTPGLLRAQLGLGWTHFEDFSFGWSADPQKSLQKSYELACEAAAAEPGLYSTRCLLSYVHFNRRQYGEAIEECARARADNPNDPEVLLHEGHVLSCTGRTETGIDRVEEAISLDPTHPNWFHYVHGIAAFEAERFETSRVAVNRYIELQHGPFVGLKASALRVRAAANALSGRIDAARQDADEYLALKPDFRVSAYVRGMPRQDPIVSSA